MNEALTEWLDAMTNKSGGDNSLIAHARYELERAGLFDKDSDYDGMLGDAALELITTFAGQNHSGFSASTVVGIFHNLAGYRPLTPLTYMPDEWNEVGENMWQNRRDGSVFSEDEGVTWYDVDNPLVKKTGRTP